MSLQARNLAVGYRGRSVASGLDLDWKPGEALCLLGPNGGGKTTLFRSLLGLIPTLSGELTLDGRPLADWPRQELARRLAYVPQGHAPQFAFSVAEIVLMGRAAHLPAYASPGERDRARAAAALQALGIAHLAGRPYTEISGGERQLCLVARALAQEAELIVLDEPTASLDFGNQARVLDQLAGLKASGVGLLFATHDPAQAFALADRVLMLGRGRVLHQGPPATTITPETLGEIYGVSAEVVETASGRRACVAGAR